MLYKITRILSGFVLALAFVFPSVSIAEDYMQLYVSPPTKNHVQATKAELQSVSIAEDYMQLYVNPPIKHKVTDYIPERQSPLTFGATIDSGMYYDFYYHYQNPKPHPEKQRILFSLKSITSNRFVKWWRSLFEYPGS